MKYRNLRFVISYIIISVFILQSHSDGRATRDRDNTGAPGGQTGGNGMMITCQNCHENANFVVDLNLELLDADNNLVTQYIPNETYTAKVTIESISGDTPIGYGFQMVSLKDTDDSDVNGWVELGHSTNAQLVLANSTGRTYAEHDGMSSSNEFMAEWKAPDTNSGDVSFYIAGIGTNGNAASAGDHAPTPIKVTFSESIVSSISNFKNMDITIYPNPTDHSLNISGDINNMIIEIYQSEKLIQSMVSKKRNIKLSLDNLSPGLYFIVIKNEANEIIATKKAIKN